MRILQGSKSVEAPPGWRTPYEGRHVVVDLGAGDGRWAYEEARRDPDTLFIAIDPDATTLAEYAYRAARKPARGGAGNVSFAVASVELLPPELLGLAGLVRVNFPWGSLLRGLVLPEEAALRGLASLGAAGSRFEIVFSYDPVHDLAGLGGLELPRLSLQRIDDALSPTYAAAGLHIEGRRQMSLDEAIAMPSTWGRRLLHGRPRDVFWVEGSISAS